MNEIGFADAARPTPVVVLNIPLQAFSLGHALLLFRRRNPFIILDESDFTALPYWQQIAAIREVAWICSDPYSARAKFEQPGWFSLGFRWNEWKRRRWAAQLKNLTAADYELAAADLRNYLSESQSLPPSPGKFASLVCGYVKEKPGRAFGQPLVLTLYSFVVKLPDSERPKCAWDFPFALANWLYFAHCEAEGAFRIENHREYRLQCQEAEHLRAIAAEQAAQKEDSAATERDPATVSGHPSAIPNGLATPPPSELVDQSATENRQPKIGKGGE